LQTDTEQGKKQVIAEETLGVSSARLEIPPRKLLVGLAQKTGVSEHCRTDIRDVKLQ
jgi:hypothetical protein